MASEIALALLAGALGLGGALAGAAMNAWTARVADERRVAEEDARRWLADRRRIYANYLVTVEHLLQEIDGTAVFLSYDGKQRLSARDEAMLEEGWYEFLNQWEEDLQPKLAEVQLMAEAKVADLAERASSALTDLSGFVESRDAFTDYYPAWFQAQDMAQVLRNAMREELGLPAFEPSAYPREPGWPWLPDRPPRDSYKQNHTSLRRS